jgi:hypothetical protein
MPSWRLRLELESDLLLEDVADQIPILYRDDLHRHVFNISKYCPILADAQPTVAADRIAQGATITPFLPQIVEGYP